MISVRVVFLALVIVAGGDLIAKRQSPSDNLGVRREARGASVPMLEVRGGAREAEDAPRVRVAEAAPVLLCAGFCDARTPAAAPAALARGPVCAFNAVGTSRTFATLCDLEAASCRDSTFYAIASIGEC